MVCRNASSCNTGSSLSTCFAHLPSAHYYRPKTNFGYIRFARIFQLFTGSRGMERVFGRKNASSCMFAELKKKKQPGNHTIRPRTGNHCFQPRDRNASPGPFFLTFVSYLFCKLRTHPEVIYVSGPTFGEAMLLLSLHHCLFLVFHPY